MSNVKVHQRVVQIERTMGYGSLVVKAANRNIGDITTLYHLDEYGCEDEEYYATVNEYIGDDGAAVYAAVFPTLLPGTYKVAKPGYTSVNTKKITIFPDNVARVNYT